MIKIGYAHLIESLGLRGVRPRAIESFVSPGVNQKTTSGARLMFPQSALPVTLVEHLEFALKHEGIDLGVISAVFNVIPPGQLSSRFNESPNGEYIRRLCFMWEWLKGEGLPGIDKSVSATYIEMFPSDRYATSPDAVRHSRFRVADNALGNRNFCPVVKLETLQSLVSADYAQSAMSNIRNNVGEKAFSRALQYLYLSETKSSFAIEKERPDANKIDRFVSLLQTCADGSPITEDSLVSAQNKIVRDAFAQEASFRLQQNWLEDGRGQITVFPPSPKVLPALMDGWIEFVNSTRRIHPVIKAACGAFGFVYLHPFFDGNGRIHRFLIHKILTQAGFVRDGAILPVSTVMLNDIEGYLGVLNAFSAPVKSMWNYERSDVQSQPRITGEPGADPYRFFEADAECDYLSKSIVHALNDDLPNEIAYLEKFDRCMTRLSGEVELPQKDLSLLVRAAIEQDGVLSKNRRKQYPHLPETIFQSIEEVVTETFEFGAKDDSALPVSSAAIYVTECHLDRMHRAPLFPHPYAD